MGSDLVGKPWEELNTEITYRDTTNFAALFNDINPYYLDDERNDGIIAPLMFPITKTIPLLHKIYDQLPQDVFDTRVHYTEQMEFFRIIRPGDKIIVNPVIVSIRPCRSGTHVIFKVSVTDKEKNPFMNEYHGVMLRGVECTDQGKDLGDMPSFPKFDATGKKPLWEAEIPIGADFNYLYDACTGISFGIHTSPRFAHAVGLPDILVPGLATLAFSLAEIIKIEAEGNPTVVKAISGKLVSMVFPRSSIKIQLLGRENDNNSTKLYFQIVTNKGNVALKNGYVKLSS